MNVTAADRARLEQWWAWCLAHSGALPPDVRPVQVRLVRAVGVGHLPDTGPVFVKVMGFPRWRDRLRYAFRTLPGVHEAKMLRLVRQHQIEAAEVVVARGARRLGLPALSFLVTAALATADAPVTEMEMARIVAALAAAGVLHPDVHPGNFVRLTSGGVAILDLQSARRRRPPLGRARRVALAATLAANWPPATVDAVHLTGLVPASALPVVLARGARRRQEAVIRRIRRCLTTSTEFEVAVGWRGKTYRRRSAAPGGQWIEGGAELARYWLGDRALEVLDGRPPTLGALFRKSWWLPGRHRVYISPHNRGAVLSTEASILLEGFQRFRAMTGGHLTVQ